MFGFQSLSTRRCHFVASASISAAPSVSPIADSSSDNAEASPYITDWMSVRQPGPEIDCSLKCTLFWLAGCERSSAVEKASAISLPLVARRVVEAVVLRGELAGAMVGGQRARRVLPKLFLV